MWIDEPIEARVEFPHCLAFPRLLGIRFRDEAVDFSGPIHVDETPSALLYRTRVGAREYAVRFEPARQRWVLEAVRDAAASC